MEDVSDSHDAEELKRGREEEEKQLRGLDQPRPAAPLVARCVHFLYYVGRIHVLVAQKCAEGGCCKTVKYQKVQSDLCSYSSSCFCYGGVSCGVLARVGCVAVVSFPATQTLAIFLPPSLPPSLPSSSPLLKTGLENRSHPCTYTLYLSVLLLLQYYHCHFLERGEGRMGTGRRPCQHRTQTRMTRLLQN